MTLYVFHVRFRHNRCVCMYVCLFGHEKDYYIRPSHDAYQKYTHTHAYCTRAHAYQNSTRMSMYAYACTCILFTHPHNCLCTQVKMCNP